MPGRALSALSCTLLVFIGGLLSAACHSISLRSDYDPEADFQSLRSFAWQPPPKALHPHPFVDNSLLRKQVRSAVRAELRARGYREVAAEEADFLVTFHVTLQSKNRSFYYGQPYGGGFYGGAV